MQKALFEVKKPVEEIDPDFYDRPSTPDEIAARQRVREYMLKAGWKLIYPIVGKR